MLAMLREYLARRGISRRLTLRVQRNAVYALQMIRQNCSEADVQLLQMISEPLLMEIHFEVRARVLQAHPFFQFLQDKCPAAVCKVCHHSVRAIVLSPGDVLFVDQEAT